VEVTGNVSLEIEPRDIDFLISELVVNKFSNATFSSFSVNSSLTLERGSRLCHYPGSIVSVTNQTRIRVNWRNWAIPRVALHFDFPAFPRSMELFLDLNERFLDLNDYIETFYGQTRSFLIGIPWDAYAPWAAAVRFRAAVPAFNSSSCILSVECVPQDGERAAIAIVVSHTIARATVAPSETPRPFTLPENTTTVIVALVTAFGMGICIISAVFVLVEKGCPVLGFNLGCWSYSNPSDSHADNM
jgi:hypothetical protein